MSRAGMIATALMSLMLAHPTAERDERRLDRQRGAEQSNRRKALAEKAARRRDRQ